MDRRSAERVAAAVALGVAVGGGLGCERETWPTHVACVGDSITQGDGASSPAETYPAALQGMLGAKTIVQGFGHSSATALGRGRGQLPYESQPEYAAATAFVRDAGPNARVAVVILLGANDSKAASWDAPGRKDAFRADYAALVDHFAGLATQPTVYLAKPLGLGPSPCCGIRGDVLTNDIAPVVESLAASHHFPVVDLTTLVSGHPELLVDGVHPNDKGYELLAAKVRETLVSQPPRPHAGGSWLTRLFGR